MKTKLSGGMLANPAGEKSGRLDILIEDGHIKAIAKDVGSADRVYDIAGRTVFPGFIDLHCHLREPGQEYKEDIASGTRAAAKGGFTAVCCMPNTVPVMDNAAVCALVLEKARHASTKVYPVAAVTKGLSGAELTEMGELAEMGCVAFSDDGRPIANGAVMRAAMQYADTFGSFIMAHEECSDLVGKGVMNEGQTATVLGLQGITRVAEEAMIARDVLLAQTYGLCIHIQHVSTRGGVEIIRAAKAKGVRVTCETCPHYFSADESFCVGYDTNAKVNPPLRTSDDMQAVREGLMDGTIDVIATDHAPHHNDDKQVEFALALSGISGFETAFSLTRTHLTDDADMIARLMSVHPASLIGRPGGVIREGVPADLNVADMDAEYVVTERSLLSKGKNTPFLGHTLRGIITHTFVDGQLVYDGGEICG